MSYSINEISIINQSGLAEDGLLYYTIDGDAYKGTPEGRLIFVDPDFVQLQDSVQSIEEITTVEEKTIAVEQASSYFGIDSGGDLTPIDNIPQVLQNNIFVLDLTTGDLTPTDAANNNALDIFFEFNASADITPKVL